MNSELSTGADRFRNRWYSLVIIILAAIYLFGWFYSVHLAVLEQERGATAIMPVVEGDSQDYAGLTQSLVSGQGFRVVGDPALPETFRTPGYPAFIAGFSFLDNGSYFSVTLVQILLVFITAFCIQRLGQLFFSESVGMVAAILFLIDPEVFYLSHIILSDVLFVFLFLLGFYLLAAYLRTRPVAMTIIAALLFSFAVYVRPMGLFALPIFVAPVIISRATFRQKCYSAVAIILIICASLVPWMIRNYTETGVFGFTSLRAYDFASDNVPLFLASKGIPQTETFAAIEQQSGVPIAHWTDLADSAALNKVSDAILLAHPISYLIFHVERTIVGSFSSSIVSFATDYGRIISMSPPVSSLSLANFTHGWHLAAQTLAYNWWRIPERFWWLLVYLFVLAALVVRRRSLTTWVLFLVPVYIVLLVGPEFVDVRFRVPAEPFILLLACAGAASVAAWIRASEFYSRYSIAGRYIISGCTAGVVNLSILYVLTKFFSVWYLISSAAAFLAALVVSFTLQKFWTFKDRSMNIVGRQFFVYASIAVFNLLINLILMYVFTSVLGIWYILSQVLAAGSIALVSFFLYRAFVFSAE